jgi:hypothetical protein
MNLWVGIYPKVAMPFVILMNAPPFRLVWQWPCVTELVLKPWKHQVLGEYTRLEVEHGT